MNKAQAGKKVAKKPVKKRTSHPNDDYKNMVDPATGKKGTMGGEGTRPPFTPEERKKMPKVGNMGSAKNGKSFKKAQNGTLQPMGKNSRKVGEGKYVSEDGNYKLKFKGGSDTSAPTSAVQRRTLKGFLKGAPKAGFKTKMAQNGTPIKKFKTENQAADAGFKKINGVYSKPKVTKPAPKPKMKSGGSMKKCKYGCK
jgi:hypothetical protein